MSNLSESGSLTCTVNVQHVDSTSGCVIASKLYKEASLALGRNDLNELVIRGVLGNHPSLYHVHRLQLYKKFVKEGKATLFFPAHNVRLLLSNAAPDKLLLFVRTLSAKLAKATEMSTACKRRHPLGDVSSKARLSSGVRRTFDDISPITDQDISALQRLHGSKALPSSTTPPTSKALNKQMLSLSSKDKENLVPGAPFQCDAAPLPPAKRMLSLHSQLSALTPGQLVVLDAVSKGKNIFFTGAAGTGKTYLLRRILGSLPPASTVATASTGVAACHINGMTLHAFAGIGSGANSLEQSAKLAAQAATAARWRHCSHLVIDEISMVDGRFFDKLEAIARLVRNSDAPFGGIQLILCGDFFQLPPVIKDGSKKFYCFQAACWKKCVNAVMELTDVKRQKDSDFIEMLHHVREGRCSQLVETMLSAASARDVARDGVVATRLCTHNEDVDALNSMYLGQLPGTVHTFTAVDSDPDLSNTMNLLCGVPHTLDLKTGAQVMLAKNLDVRRGLVNGSRGVVTGFHTGKQGCPIIKFYAGPQEVIGWEKWTTQRCSGQTLSRRQLPLKLAWSISVHKSQGMTLDCVEVSLSRAFECGQAYVALSRARGLDGLKVSDFSPSCIRADPHVIDFYERLRRKKAVECHMEDEPDE